MNRLFRIFSRLAAALLVLLPITAPAEDKAAAPPPVRPALWKVSDKDTTIYLFGTVHILPSGIDWYQGKVAEAFEGSQELVTEIVQDGSAQADMTQLAALPQGQTLRAMLAPEDRAKYEAALGVLGLPPEMFDGYEPWLAALTLSILPLTHEGLSPDNGVDEALGVKAKARGLPHGALETPEYQLSLFDSLPIATQKVYLSQVVRDMPTVTAEIAKMTDAWKTGDAAALAELMNAQEDYPGMREILLTNRNKAWAGWVKQRLTKPGTVFLAVGAGHLAGEGSVQEQLAAQGISSQRLQ